MSGITDTRERKRARDRDIQRLKRVKTKAYVSQLENEVADLRRSSASRQELAKTVEGQFEELRKKREGLQGTLNRIARIATDVATSTLNPRPSTPAKTLSPTLRIGNNSAAAACNPPSNQAHDNHKMTSAWPSPNFEEDAYKSQILHGLSPTDSISSEILSDFFAPVLREPNMFTCINNMILTLLSDCRTSVSDIDDAQDCDTCIRAVVLGWDAISFRAMDPVWTVVQALDSIICQEIGTAERLAMVRLLRMILLNLLYPDRTKDHPLPTYLQPTRTQASTSHAPLIDILIWPSLRDLMIITNTSNVTQQQILRYAQDLTFDWPYEMRDLYKTEVGTALYSFSKEFDERFCSSQSWTLKLSGCKCLFQRTKTKALDDSETVDPNSVLLDGICVICDLDFNPTTHDALGLGDGTDNDHIFDYNAIGAEELLNIG